MINNINARFIEDVNPIEVSWVYTDKKTGCTLRTAESFTLAEAQVLARKLADAIRRTQRGDTKLSIQAEEGV